MGVTGAIFKGLTFDGEDSKDYGVYITGQAVYNSPERDVEMISIPGRDGAFAMDLGRFSNIEVTYPAGLFGVDEADFAQAIADFRNMLGSRVGYCRLEDEYNPGEYREAIFKAGLEVTPASLESGQFDIVFECKPQRWLTSGEDAVAITSGDDITNPTLFDSKPMLQVWGYGDIDMGGQTMSLANNTIGYTLASNGTEASGITASPWVFPISYSMATIGDTIDIGASTISFAFGRESGVPALDLATVSSTTWTNGSGSFSRQLGSSQVVLQASLNATSASVGSASPAWQASAVILIGSGGLTETFTISFNIVSGAGGMALNSLSISSTGNNVAFFDSAQIKLGPIHVNSTKTALGSPTYIDLDIGEAYYYSGGDVVSANSAVSLPAILPTLPPGATTITFDNTITQFKVVPRWWQL